jgi:hypothetical protein
MLSSPNKRNLRKEPPIEKGAPARRADVLRATASATRWEWSARKPASVQAAATASPKDLHLLGTIRLPQIKSSSDGDEARINETHCKLYSLLNFIPI